MSVSDDPAELLLVALAAARTAGAQLRERQLALDTDDLQVDTKSSHTDPVSEADREAERTIAQIVLDRRPDDGLIGEEDQADRAGTSGLRWVVDPLDGTVNWLHRQPQWSVSVAVEDDDGPIVGVVHHPALRETFHALRGGGAWHAQRRLTVVDPPALDEVMLSTGFGYAPDLRHGQLESFGRWASAVRYVRRQGSAALDIAWVAAGRSHAHVEAGLHRWDVSAGRLLVEEAGGRVSEVEVAYDGVGHTTVVAAGRSTHDRLVELITGDVS